MKFKTFEELGGKLFFQRRYAELDNKQWSAFNSSVMLSNEGEYWLAFRSSNYVFVKNEEYFFLTNDDNKVTNKLFLVKLNKKTWQFEEDTLKQIDTKSFRSSITRDVEDPRLFWDGNNYCISATYLEKDCQVAKICKITLESLENPNIKSLVVLDSYDSKVTEKNWMPIHKTKKSKIDFIHSSGVVFFDNKFIKINYHPKTKSFRGSSQVLPLEDNTYLALIHEAEHYYVKRFNQITMSNRVRVLMYSHRFILMNKDFEIVKCSDKFIFSSKEGFDFASGIAPSDNGYVISLGRSDCATYIATISKDNLLATLKDIDV